jgi:hypothetical protein
MAVCEGAEIHPLIREKVFENACTVGPLPPAADMRSIALGFQKTAVMTVVCGGCTERWEDALMPKEETAVECPHCGGSNRITLCAEMFPICSD